MHAINLNDDESTCAWLKKHSHALHKKFWEERRRCGGRNASCMLIGAEGWAGTGQEVNDTESPTTINLTLAASIFFTPPQVYWECYSSTFDGTQLSLSVLPTFSDGSQLSPPITNTCHLSSLPASSLVPFLAAAAPSNRRALWSTLSLLSLVAEAAAEAATENKQNKAHKKKENTFCWLCDFCNSWVPLVVEFIARVIINFWINYCRFFNIYPPRAVNRNSDAPLTLNSRDSRTRNAPFDAKGGFKRFADPLQRPPLFLSVQRWQLNSNKNWASKGFESATGALPGLHRLFISFAFCRSIEYPVSIVHSQMKVFCESPTYWGLGRLRA